MPKRACASSATRRARSRDSSFTSSAAIAPPESSEYLMPSGGRMSIANEIGYLLDYTEWDRAQWEPWFRAQGPDAFAVPMGENADGRIANIGELVRHIFSAEQRYVERIRELPIS